MAQFSVEKFNAALATRSFGRVLHYHPSLDSSNRLLKDLAGQGAPEGTLVLADEQSAGRGRWGRTWEGVKEKGLLLSLLLRPRAGLLQSQLAAVIGVALLRAVNELAPGAGVK